MVQRLAVLAHKNRVVFNEEKLRVDDEYCELMNKFEFSRAFDWTWEKVQAINRRIDDEKPWILAKNGEKEKLKWCLKSLIRELLVVNLMLSPFLPEVTEKISGIFTAEIIPPMVPLFPKN